MKLFRRILLASAIVGCALTAQVLIGTIADITGDASAHKVSATSLGATWIQFDCPSGNSGTAIRIGDSNVSSSRGALCAAGKTVIFPVVNRPPYRYDLSTIYYLAANNDKLTVTYGK